MIIDAPVAQNAVEKSGGVEIAEKVPTEETYGIAVAKDNSELLEEINGGLEEVISDGTYTKIYEKWFHLEPPKAIVGYEYAACRTRESAVVERGAGFGAPLDV